MRESRKPNRPLSPQSNDRTMLLMARVDEMRVELRAQDPFKLMQRVSGRYVQTQSGKGELRLALWGREIFVTFPDFIAFEGSSQQKLHAGLQALVIYYLYTTDGAPIADRFISFSELPDGKFYAQAFQGYTGQELQHHFGDDRQRFERAAQNIGGRHYPLGDASFTFQLLPRVVLLVVFWCGDEDFPSSYQVLFDASISHHLPIDVCAVAGSMLTRQLIESE